MATNLNILIMEDHPMQSLKLKNMLSEYGYEHIAIAGSIQKALQLYQEQVFDVLLLDINMGSTMNGIEACKIMQDIRKVSHIYLTAQSDHFEFAKATNPAAFFSKPYNEKDLPRAIELAIQRHVENSEPELAKNNPEKVFFPRLYLPGDCFWIKQSPEKRELFMKVLPKDIFLFKADNVYVEIYTTHKKQPIVVTLSLSKLAEALEGRPGYRSFVQVSRSCIVNLDHIKSFPKDLDTVTPNNDMTIPVSENYRALLRARLGNV